jgi:uncharacterized protein YodC (DUF2158 family)
MEIKVGDTVQLKSVGRVMTVGPVMTVTDIDGNLEGNHTLICTWCNPDGKSHTERFLATAVKVVPA